MSPNAIKPGPEGCLIVALPCWVKLMPKAEKIYYHGTWNRYAYSIMTQGFKLGEEGHGQLLSRGVYVAQQLSFAANWSHDIVITCKILSGTRILWIQEGYDRKIIRYLRKEFGQELLDLGPHFHKAIPRNKQLTKRELITLCNHIFETRRKKQWQYALRKSKGKRAQYRDGWLQLSWLCEHVKRHDFDALGDRSYEYWDSDEILIFNPSRVVPITAHWLYADDDFEDIRISEPIDVEELKGISAEAQAEYERFLEESEDAEDEE